jgi:hypothetical protein
MSRDPRRISLVGRPQRMPHRDWDDSQDAASRLLFVESLTVLRHAIDHGIEMGVDVERVIIDRLGDAQKFLELIASLHYDFLADVVFITRDDHGFLSSMGRGGNRVLYALGPDDVRFYLETHELVTGRMTERRLIA